MNLVSKYGYHGNTKSCINISSYKFDGEGGEGKPDITHVFPIPDTFRGFIVEKILLPTMRKK